MGLKTFLGAGMFGSLAKRKYQDIGETRPDQETLTIILQAMRVLKGGEWRRQFFVIVTCNILKFFFVFIALYHHVIQVQVVKNNLTWSNGEKMSFGDQDQKLQFFFV